MTYNYKRHIVYIARWVVLAVPGAWFLAAVQSFIPSQFWAMVVSQGILGAGVFFIDRLIFRENTHHGKNVQQRG